jgi:uncharacterized phage-associated protein
MTSLKVVAVPEPRGDIMASVHDVAAYILGRERNLSTMKLQKLCYYAQGWHLAWRGEPLFPEPLQAWRMGPVSPDLYRYHRGQASVSAWPQGDEARLTAVQKGVVDTVIDFYDPYSGFELGNRTHSERPWLEAWEMRPAAQRGHVEISQNTLMEYFRDVERGN